MGKLRLLPSNVPFGLERENPLLKAFLFWMQCPELCGPVEVIVTVHFSPNKRGMKKPIA